jgi:hypothetical protein
VGAMRPLRRVPLYTLSRRWFRGIKMFKVNGLKSLFSQIVIKEVEYQSIDDQKTLDCLAEARLADYMYKLGYWK